MAQLHAFVTGLEARLQDALLRLGQADRALRDHGRDPDSFQLHYFGGGTRDILHSGWDDSWAVPTAEDIDDLAELGYVRTEPAGKSRRHFALAVKGRQEAAALERRTPSDDQASAPPPGRIWSWLRELDRSLPEALNEPSKLLEAAIDDDLISASGSEALAERILDLVADGYLRGQIPDWQQASAEDRLRMSAGLRLTVKAEAQAKPSTGAGTALNFYGSVVAGQIAAGDISNYVSVGELLDRTERALDELDGVSEEDREGARSLLALLRGQAIEAPASVLTGASRGTPSAGAGSVDRVVLGADRRPDPLSG